MTPADLTSDWLRFRPSNGVIPLNADCAAVLASALELADHACRSKIEQYAPLVVSFNPSYYDISAADPSFGLEKAAEYLEARGKLIRCNTPGMVRFPESSA